MGNPLSLRYYQEEAKQAIKNEFARGERTALFCIPTGGGKTPVLVDMLREMFECEPHEKFLALSHTKELVRQGTESYARFTGRQASVYSASLGRKEIGAVTFGQIQSVSRARYKLNRIRCVLIDECDRIPPDGDGQYQSLIKELSVVNPDLFIIGCTATPYRMGSGLVYGEGRLFNKLCYDAKVLDLISHGYLCKLNGKQFDRPTCLTNVSRAGGDYNQGELDAAMAADVEVIDKSVAEIASYRNERKGCIIFASGEKHGLLVQEAFRRIGLELPFVTGNTPSSERDDVVARFSRMELWGIININVYTVGFDVPHVDLIAMLRPTKSAALYYQTAGRGFRIFPGKTDCVILDFAGNIQEHGPIDTLNERIKMKKKRKSDQEMPQKICEACGEPNAIGALICVKCSHPFPPRKIVNHTEDATNQQPLTVLTKLKVTAMRAFRHANKNGGPSTIRLDFFDGYLKVASKWLTISQEGNPYARRTSLLWLHSARKVGQPTFTIYSGAIYGHTSSGHVAIQTAEDMLPYCDCLMSPTAIETLPQRNDPKYVDIINMYYDEPCLTTTSQ